MPALLYRYPKGKCSHRGMGIGDKQQPGRSRLDPIALSARARTKGKFCFLGLRLPEIKFSDLIG